ncbi:MBOAT family O-acyltransferase (plasmid) [Clostridium perfringens]
MVFSSLIFLFIFLPIFLGIYFLVPKKFKNLILFLFSLVFYAWGEPIYVVIMLFSTVYDYTIGLFMDRYRSNKYIPRICLVLSILGNMGMLMFFKYSNFFIENINNIFNMNVDLLSVALPIGISFYTFQTMSYTIDLYRNKISVQRNIISFGAYVAMFPQLIAGPIVTYSKVEKEIDNRSENLDKFTYGITRFIEGLAKKVLIANGIGMLWEQISNSFILDMSVATAWLGMVAFGLQLYFDFSGYSDMAIGLGSMLGFNFPENFNYPYISRSVTEFWRRWHITLGSWFREYVYIPLGGNRVSKKRFLINIGIVWFLTGFWHGASWNFVLWGVYFGVIMIFEKVFLLKHLEKLPNVISRSYLLITIILSWVLFSMDSLKSIKNYFMVMFGFGQGNLIDDNFMYLISNYGILLIIGVIFTTPVSKYIKKYIREELMYFVYIIILILVTAYLVDSTFNPFLYFRF